MGKTTLVLHNLWAFKCTLWLENFFNVHIIECANNQAPARLHKCAGPPEPLLVSCVIYRNYPKFSDRYAWANNTDPDQEQSDQGLHCLPFCLHRLDSLLYGTAT